MNSGILILSQPKLTAIMKEIMTKINPLHDVTIRNRSKKRCELFKILYQRRRGFLVTERI